jgi:hypothetical protein
MRLNFLELFLPKEGKFYTYLIQQASNLHEAGNAFQNIIAHLPSMSVNETKQAFFLIKKYERKGDEIERQIIKELNRSFITPMDREDIHEMVIVMDRALDAIDGLARRFEIYSLHEVPKDVLKFFKIIEQISSELVKLMQGLQKREGVLQTIENMHALENAGDEAYHVSMADLFRRQDDVTYIIKFKEIYEMLEDIIDTIDYIGKTVRGILVKL